MDITELLNDIKLENERNSENFEKALTAINAKLEIIENDNEATDLIKVYIAELKKSVEDKFLSNSTKFDELKKNYNEIISSQTNLVAKDDLSALSDTFFLNLTSLSSEITQQKTSLTELVKNIENISKTSCQKSELDKMFSSLKIELNSLNSGIDRTLSQVIDVIKNSNFEPKIQSLSSEINNNNQQIKDLITILNEKVDVIATYSTDTSSFDDLGDQVAEVSSAMESLKVFVSDNFANANRQYIENFETLERNFASIVTGTDFAKFRSDLADFVQKIIDNSNALNSELSYSTERIENILTTVKSLDFRDDFANIVDRINDIKESFEDNSKLNYENICKNISELEIKFSEYFDNFNNQNDNVYSSLKGEISLVLSNLENLLQISYQKSFDELTGVVGKIAKDVNELGTSLNSNMDSNYENITSSIGSLISNLQIVKEDIIEKTDLIYDNSSDNFSNLNDRLGIQIEQLDDLKREILESKSLEPSELLRALDRTTQTMTSVVDSIKDNNSQNCKNLQETIEELSANIGYLQSEFRESLSHNTDKLISDISRFSTDVYELREELKQSSQAHVENSSRILNEVANTSSKISNFEQNIIVSSNDQFEELKNKLNTLSENINSELQNHKELFSNSSDNQFIYDSFEKIAFEIKNIENSNVNNSKEVIQKVSNLIEELNGKIEELKNSDGYESIKYYIDEISHNINNSQNEIREELRQTSSATFENSSKILSEIENVSNKISNLDENISFGEQFNNLKYNLNSLLEQLSSDLQQQKQLIEDNSDNQNIIENLEKITEDIKNAHEFVTSNTQDIKQIIEQNSDKQTTNFVNVVSHISDFKEEFRQLINQNIEEITKNFTELKETDSKYESIKYYIDELFHNINNSHSELVESFNQYYNRNFENSSRILSEIENVSNKISNLNENISFGEQFDSLKYNLNSLLEQLSSDLQQQKQLIEDNSDNQNIIDNLEKIAQDVRVTQNHIESNSQNLTVNITEFVEEIKKDFEELKNSDKLEPIKYYIDEISHNISNSQNEIREEFRQTSSATFENSSKILSEIENVSNKISNLDENISFGEQFDNLKYNLNSLLEQLSSDLQQQKQLIEDNSDNQNIIDNLEKIAQDIRSTQEFVTSNTQDIKQIIEQNSDKQTTNFVNVVSHISDFKEEFRQLINQNIEEITKNFTELKETDSRYETIKYYIDDLFHNINNSHSELVESFNQYNSNYSESSSKIITDIENINNKVESLEANLQLDEKFENIKTNLTSLSDQIIYNLSEHKESITENKAIILENLEKTLLEIQNAYELVNNKAEDFRQDIYSQFENIKSDINVLNNSISENNSNNIEMFSSKLQIIDEFGNKFELSLDDLSTKIQEIKENINQFDFNNFNEEIQYKLNDININSNSILDNIFDQQRKYDEFANILTSLLEIVSKKDEIEELNYKIDGIQIKDYSLDFEQINSKISEVCSLFENSSNSNFINLSNKIDEIKIQIENNNNTNIITEQISNLNQNIDSVKSVIDINSQTNLDTIVYHINEFSNLLQLVKNEFAVSNETNSKIYNDKIEELKTQLDQTNTKEDLAEFRTNFTEFIEKILNNSLELQANSDSLKDQLSRVLDILDNPKDYSLNFENISNEISDIKTTFETNSKNNFENILDEINHLKTYISSEISNSDKTQEFEKINEVINDLSLGIKFLNDVSSEKQTELLNNVTNELNCISDEIKEKINSNIDLNVGEMKTSIENIVSQINEIKEEFTKNQDTNLFNISSNFDSVKINLENILIAFNSLSESINDISEKSSNTIIENVQDISVKVEELKTEINKISSDYMLKALDAVNDVSIKIDELQNNNNSLDINYIKNSVIALTSNLELFNEEILHNINESSNNNSLQLKVISQDINNFENQINSTIDSLRNYITELDTASNSSQNTNVEKIVQNLLDIETSIVNNSQDYEQKLETLQSKISEFANIVENNNIETDSKIVSSIEEIKQIQNEINQIENKINEFQSITNEKFENTTSILDSGIENVSYNLNELTNNINNSLTTSISENISSLNNRFDIISEVIENIKNDNHMENDKVLIDLEEKTNFLRNELSLVNTDIVSAFESKAEDIIRNLEPIKLNIDEILGFDLEKTLGNLKTELELSFMNFSADMNSEFANNIESISKLEQAYKELFNKIEIIEETVSEKNRDSINLVNNAIENGLHEIRISFGEIFEEYIIDLKSYINSTCAFEKYQASINELKQDNEDIIETLDEVNTKLDIVVSDTTIDDIKNQIDKFAGNFQILNTKVDTITLDNSVANSIDNVQEKLESINANNNKISNTLDLINEKIDIVALDNSNNDSINEVQEKIELINFNNNKISNILNLINEKIDTVVLESSETELLDGIDNLKEIIFEQRKYFEQASDERAAAIDRYLRDVLIKLENVDIEKSAYEIKDNIMTALVSLPDQISFDEETEDIKEFVEEKTESIKENIKEVQKQLKQLTSAEEENEYTYTLQDVESDIARLRIAINNFSDTDFDSFSGDIKKIINSVENIQSSLTQDQITELKNDFEKINEDIVSISTRTNKLLLSSEESYKAINNGMNDFSSIIYKLEDRINYLDATEANERIEKKLDKIHALTSESSNADKVMYQVMQYLGEWIDSTTADISRIENKVDNITNKEVRDIKSNISEISIPKTEEIVEKLSEIIPQKDEIVNDIKVIIPSKEEILNELQEIIPDNTNLLKNIEQKFTEQEDRIEQLEIKLEKILSNLEEKDDIVVNRKIDKLEKIILGLDARIEKLTSYIDE